MAIRKVVQSQVFRPPWQASETGAYSIASSAVECLAEREKADDEQPVGLAGSRMKQRRIAWAALCRPRPMVSIRLPVEIRLPLEMKRIAPRSGNGAVWRKAEMLVITIAFTEALMPGRHFWGCLGGGKSLGVLFPPATPRI